jgi:hypothetical protein
VQWQRGNRPATCPDAAVFRTNAQLACLSDKHNFFTILNPSHSEQKSLKFSVFFNSYRATKTICIANFRSCILEKPA